MRRLRLDDLWTFAIPSGKVRELTRHTRAALPEVEFIEPQEREFTVHDGTVVHGWVVRDPATAGAGPLLLDVHGGPHLAWGPHLEMAHPYHQLLAAQGWTVLLLNPRASDGYGEQFYAASPGRWGIGDEPDFLDPLDQLVAEGLADPDRLAVCGYSYGGFSACRLTTRTDRFVGGSASNLAIGHGTSINVECFFDCLAKVTFGRNVMVGMGVMIVTSDHPVGPDGRPQGEPVGREVVISDRAWLGARPMILPGVTVGEGFIISAGAVVARDCDVTDLLPT